MNRDQAIQKLTEVARLKHLSLATEESYCGWLARFCEFVAAHPEIALREAKVEALLDEAGDWRTAEDDCAPTCVAHYAKDVSTRLVADGRFPGGARPYSVREYARLQGVPDSFAFAGSERDAYRMIGNGVSVPVGEWVGTEVCRYFRN